MVKIGQKKCLAIYLKTQVRFIIAGDVDQSIRLCCATFKIFKLFAVTCSQKTRRLSIVAFPLQQWLRERATMQRCNTLTVLCIHMLQNDILLENYSQMNVLRQPHIIVY